MFTQRSLRLLDLTGAQARVLNTLAAVRIPSTGESRLLVREIAEQVDAAAPNVSRTLTELAHRNIIFKEGTGIYRINNHIAYSGDNATEVTMDPEPQWKREEPAHA